MSKLMRRCDAVKATMKTLGNSNDALVDALYTNDPVLKLQMNGSRRKQFKPKPNKESKNSDGKRSCVWCKEDIHSVTNPQLTMKFGNSVASKEEKITHKDNNSKHQNAVDIECD